MSKSLLSYEKNYWATKLEVAALVWALQKLRHYVDSGKTVVYTDHQAIQGIFRSPKDGRKSNRLNNWQLFLSQYSDQLDIQYRPGKSHGNADGLSRIATSSYTTKPNVTLLHMDPKLRARIINAYPNDKHLSAIYKKLQNQVKSTKRDVKTTYHSFRFDRPSQLLYFLEKNGHERLCIPSRLYSTVLTHAHDDKSHDGIDRTYYRIRQNVYIPRLWKIVEDYVKGCPICQLAKPGHHKPYGELQPVLTPNSPFAALAMDFIVDLPASTNGSTVLLTVTDKFTRYLKLIAGVKTDTAMDWAERFFDRVYQDWGAPQQIVSDRDSKFTSQFWKCLFKRAKVQLALTAAYHPSADGHAERTNQTTKVALQCLLANQGEHEWESLLPDVEFALNTTKSDATMTSPFELLYGVPPRNEFSTNQSEFSSSDEFAR